MIPAANISPSASISLVIRVTAPLQGLVKPAGRQTQQMPEEDVAQVSHYPLPTACSP